MPYNTPSAGGNVMSATKPTTEPADGDPRITPFPGPISAPEFGVAGDPRGQRLRWREMSELVTIAAAATSSSVMKIPGGVIVWAVPVKVTETIDTATKFTVGDAGSAARYNNADVSPAAGAHDPGMKAGAYYNASATEVVLTPDETPGTNAGRVLVQIYYIEIGTHADPANFYQNPLA